MKEVDKCILSQNVTGRKVGYKVSSDADADIFPEGAHGFKPKIQPLLDKWQKNNQDKKQVFYHVGEPEEAPSQLIINALRQMTAEPILKKHYAYQPPEGLPELREAIVGHTERAGVYPRDVIDADSVIAGGSGKFMMHVIGRALRKKELVAGVLTPGYPGHVSAAIKATHVESNQGKHGIVGIPVTEEYHWGPDPEVTTTILEKAKPKILFLCNPQNPTGGGFNKDSAKPIVEYAEKDGEVLIVEDVVYHKYDYSKGKQVFFAQLIPDQTVIVDGSSKDLCFTGSRVSWAIFPKTQEELRKASLRQVNDLNSCASTLDSMAIIPALSREGDQVIDSLSKRYEEKKDSVVKSLKDIGLEPNHPQGAFYTMVKVPNGTTAQRFAEDAASKAGVTVLPSEYFGATLDEKGKPRVVDIYKNPFFDPNIAKDYVRVCYVGNPDQMAVGIERLGEAIKIK